MSQPSENSALRPLPQLNSLKPKSSEENKSPSNSKLPRFSFPKAESKPTIEPPKIPQKEDDSSKTELNPPAADASAAPALLPKIPAIPAASGNAANPDAVKPSDFPQPQKGEPQYLLKESPSDAESFVLPPPPPELGLDLDDDIGNAPTLINDVCDDDSESSLISIAMELQEKSRSNEQISGNAMTQSSDETLALEQPQMPKPHQTDAYLIPGMHLEKDVDNLIKEQGDNPVSDQAGKLDPTIDRHSKTMSFHSQSKLPPANSENAKYEVDVQNYAKYDNSESGYSPETEKSITYAARSPFGRFFRDLPLILTRPSVFWKGQVEHPATVAQVHWPHLAILVVLRSICLFCGAIFQSGIKLSQALILAITQLFLIFVLVWGMSVILSGLLALGGRGGGVDKTVRFVGYSITPLLIVGIISCIPIPWLTTVFDIIAMPWAFLIMGSGVHHYLKDKPETATTTTALICGLLLIFWTVLPMLIPNLLSGIFHFASSAVTLIH